MFSKGKKQKRTQELRLVAIAEGIEDDEDGHHPEASSDDEEKVNDQCAAKASAKAAVIVAHGSFNDP